MSLHLKQNAKTSGRFFFNAYDLLIEKRSNEDYEKHVYFIIQQSVDEDPEQDEECFEASFVDGTYYGVVKSISVGESTIVVQVQDEEEVLIINTAIIDCIVNVLTVCEYLRQMFSRTDVKIKAL